MKKDTGNYQLYFDTLKKSNNFSELSDDILNEILSMFYVETWPKGQLSFDGDKTLHKFYFVVSGKIKMYQFHPKNGNEHTLYIMSKGNIFDVICLMDGKKHEIKMEALDDIKLLVAPINIVRTWIEKHPDFNKTLLPYIAEQLREMESKATDLALFDTWTRTLKLFIKHTQLKVDQSELKLINELSNTELANIIGTSRNVLNKHMQVMKDKGILEVKRKNIKIKNLKRLLDEYNFS